ncbi:hypothetical protein [Paratractidigestivibacter sp.]|uniref:hypothetical protein n=1 Tax=Paratractidigestivibacter sp. TaxID=2847316 RepID=UPI002ABD9C7C|nr:hypothetical protein [Paratractidigestivibacter sp.]
MEILPIIAGFGGGVLGAYMGALPAFIMTGLFALIGGILQAAGVSADVSLLQIAFASFNGPHTAFAGGVAAAAYAGSKKKLDSGADICAALFGLGSADVILVGGIFGLVGALLLQIIGMIPVFGTITDGPGTCVFIIGVFCRLVFGKSGLTGAFEGEKHNYVSQGGAFTTNLMLGLGVGIAVSAFAAIFYEAGNITALSMWPFICFGFSAVTLVFTQTGFAVPSTHHMTLIGAYASVIGVTAFGTVGGICFGTLFAVIAALVGDFAACTLNTKVDSHIDPPATTIWILACIVHLIGAALGAPLGGIIVG